MPASRFVVIMCSVAIIVLGAGVASGQTYPNKPIRIVTALVGSNNDFVARLIAPGISGPLGQPVIVENRPAGLIQGEAVAKAPPDGYALLLAGTDLWVLPLMQNVPYDPVQDFSPITVTTRAPNILVVHPSLPVKSVKELIALAKAKPGALNYGSSLIGTSTHLAGALFTAMAGVNIVRIGYKGGGPALTDLLAGEVQLAFPPAGTATSHIKSGRLRALGVTSAQPSALAPGLPTIAASGLPGYEVGAMGGMFAPAKTPAAIINRLNQEIVRFLNAPETKERLLNVGVEASSSTPEQLAATVKSDMARLGKVIKDAGIRAE